MNYNEEEYVTIDIMQMLNALWKRLWIIAISAVAGGILVLGYTFFFVTPLYQSSAMLYVNNSSLDVGSTKIDLSDLTAAKGLVDTYAVILNSRGTLEQVIARTGVDYTYEQLKSMISTQTVNETEVFEVTVTSEDPVEAELIANCIVEVLPKRIDTILDGSAVKIVDYAIVPEARVSPSYKKNTLLGVFIGAVICCIIIIIREMLDTTVHSEDYLLKQYPNVPLLAVVPVVTESGTKNKKLNYYEMN